MELSGQTLPVALAGTTKAVVKKFSIVVPHYNRSYRYNVEQRLVGETEDIISLTRTNKTVHLSVCRPDRKSCRKKYSYDKKAISNRSFMTKVITALEQYWRHEDRGTI